MNDSSSTTNLFRPLEISATLDLQLGHELNAADWFLSRACENWSDHVALVAKDQVLTFAQVADMARAAGNVMHKCGVSIEQRVILLMDDGPALVAAFLGAMLIGAVPIPLRKSFLPHELRYIVSDSRARMAIIDPDEIGLLPMLTQTSSYLQRVLLSSPVPTSTVPSLQENIQDASTSLEAAATTADDTAFWAYSSGATGFPKASIHMHQSLPYCCAAFADNVLNLCEEDSILSLNSMSSTLGLMNSIFFPLYTGATVTIPEPKAKPGAIIETINTHRTTILFASPSHYQPLLMEAITRQASLSSLRMCLSSGQPLSPALEANWKSHFGIELLSGLSSTEALYTFTTNTLNDVRTGSVGKPVPGYKIRIEDEQGQQVKPGVVGDLFVSGGSLAAGYWNRHYRNSNTFIGCWLRTGDKCLQDEQGYLYYSGRCDDMIFVHEQWIAPSEIEKHLLEQPQIREAAVIGYHDNEGNTRLRAYVVLKSDCDTTPELANRLRVLANAEQPPAKQVKWIEFIPSLPHSADGSLQRFKLR